MHFIFVEDENLVMTAHDCSVYIDRFKKFARLGTRLLISDAIISISATMRSKHTPDDLAKSIYRFKDANPEYANSAIAQIFSISESTLRRIL